MESSRDRRILVVDDEVRGVELLARTLRRFGRVETATSGEEGWQIVCRGGVDLVISDQRMPGMTGVDLLSRVAVFDEKVGRILLSGYADLEATMDSINLGRVHAYLNKPIAPEDVQMSVRSVFDRMDLLRENFRLVTSLSEKNDELTQTLCALEAAQQRVVHSERLAAIGRMIAMIVHDLRSPISVIHASGSEIVQSSEAASNEEMIRLGREVLQETEHMQRVCESLLDVTRASESDGTIAEDDIDGLVAAGLAYSIEEAARRGIEVDLDLDSGACVLIQEDRFRRALRNLASNAIEAMEESGGVLRVESRRENAEVRISFIDTGPGIPEAVRGHLFDPFVTYGKPGGSGLGLAVVKKVVEDLGGRIEAAKPPGGGTAFHLHLPIRP